MKKISLILLVCLFINKLAYTIEHNVYEAQLVKEINYGSGVNELGFEKGIDGSHPSEMFVDDKAIYMYDQLNHKILTIGIITKKINSYPLSEESNFRDIEKIKVGNDKSLYGIKTNSSGSYLIKNNYLGEDVFNIKLSKLFSNTIIDGHYWVSNDHVYFYDNNGSPFFIDNKNKILSYDEYNSDQVTLENSKIVNFLKKNKLIISNDILLTNDIYSYQSYWALLNNKKITLSYHIYMYVGHDNYGNSYWLIRDTDKSLVFWYSFSPTGEILDKFLIDFFAYEFVLAPNGDIYAKINNKSKKQFEFYHISRN